ncbi:hypothetical protein ColTof3_14517 [Colletotrichum tofieldiae]|nr:hypothetical protein ColTof3_14517 [Colletotrichum tofieldiae]GKT97344.1 hypothetical protein Ct61P_15194 [Colletotrichum tofieldiae]
MANFFGEENRSEDGTIWTNAASPGRACFRKTRAVVYSSRLPIVQALITCVIVYKIRSAVSQLPAWLPVSIFLFGLFLGLVDKYAARETNMDTASSEEISFLLAQVRSETHDRRHFLHKPFKGGFLSRLG